MAKIRALPTPEVAHAMRGLVDIYCHRFYGWIARRWPRPHRPCESPAWKKTADRMRDGWARYKAMPPEAKAAWQRIPTGKSQSWADVMRSAFLRSPRYALTIMSHTEITITPPSPHRLSWWIRIPGAQFPTGHPPPHVLDLKIWLPNSPPRPQPRPKPFPPCPKRTKKTYTSAVTAGASKTIPMYTAYNMPGSPIPYTDVAWGTDDTWQYPPGTLLQIYTTGAKGGPTPLTGIFPYQV